MTAQHDSKALIIGAGLSGLTAAATLRRHGIDSLVFERRSDLSNLQTGSGLALGYNVARAFRHVGLLDELLTVAARFTRFEYVTDGGRQLACMEVPEGEIQLGVIRGALHRLLYEAVGDEVVRFGSNFARFEQDADGVTAHFDDGSTVRGDVLIGADGINSAVRAQLLGRSQPRYAGYATRRGVVETEHAREPRFRMLMGNTRRFMHYPVAPGVLYWTAVTPEPAGSEETPAALKRIVLERFVGWPEPVETLVEATGDARTFHADIYDRDPVDRWGEGRVTLVGDAAHPMTFFMGQGAGQGIESAVFLGEYLAQDGDPIAALRAYEALRIPRTASVIMRSRRIGEVTQWRNPAAVFVRNNLLARVMSTEFASRKATQDLQVEFGLGSPA